MLAITALAFVPFLANHYTQITLVDLSQTGRDDHLVIQESIRQGEFAQVLFAFSIETYMHRPYPAWSHGLLPEWREYDYEHEEF